MMIMGCLLGGILFSCKEFPVRSEEMLYDGSSIIIWIRRSSELLWYRGVQNFAKTDTENAELASKMLKQQYFLHQRKNLYNLISRRSSSDASDSDNNCITISPNIYIIPHRTLPLTRKPLCSCCLTICRYFTVIIHNHRNSNLW